MQIYTPCYSITSQPKRSDSPSIVGDFQYSFLSLTYTQTRQRLRMCISSLWHHITCPPDTQFLTISHLHQHRIFACLLPGAHLPRPPCTQLIQSTGKTAIGKTASEGQRGPCPPNRNAGKYGKANQVEDPFQPLHQGTQLYPAGFPLFVQEIPRFRSHHFSSYNSQSDSVDENKPEQPTKREHKQWHHTKGFSSGFKFLLSQIVTSYQAWNCNPSGDA